MSLPCHTKSIRKSLSLRRYTSIHFTSAHLLCCLIAIVIASLIEVEATALDGNSSNTVTASSVSGDAGSQFLLGRAYARGEGVPQSYEKAGFWYLKASEQGNLKAMHNLGVLYLEGKGTAKNEKEGYRLIRKAADLGDPKSTGLVGILLCNGTGVPKDMVSGKQWLEKGVRSGSAEAITFLAGIELNERGKNGAASRKRGLELLKKAAGLNDAAACAKLGDLLSGVGGTIPADPSAALDYYKRGAELGDPWCRFLYARQLLRTSPRAAYPWAKLSMEDHCAAAIGIYQECQSALNPEELAAADQEAERLRGTSPGPR